MTARKRLEEAKAELDEWISHPVGSPSLWAVAIARDALFDVMKLIDAMPKREFTVYDGMALREILKDYL